LMRHLGNAKEQLKVQTFVAHRRLKNSNTKAE
jgi:hypothetical protein